MIVKSSHGRVRKTWIKGIRRYFTSTPEFVNFDALSPVAKRAIMRMLTCGELIEEKSNE